MKKIILSVKRSKFRFDDPNSNESDIEFNKVRSKILNRDDYTCQYCGFKSMKYQEVHHLNDDHSDNSESNLITTCSLCHACHHIGYSGQTGRVILIKLPVGIGVSQAELNQIVRSLWVGEMSKDDSVKMLSVNYLARLYKQTVAADRGMGTTDATVLGDFLLQLPAEDYKERESKLKGYFALPLKEGFGPQIQYWCNNVFNSNPATTWIYQTEKKAQKWERSIFGNNEEGGIIKMLNNKKE